MSSNISSIGVTCIRRGTIVWPISRGMLNALSAAPKGPLQAELKAHRGLVVRKILLILDFAET